MKSCPVCSRRFLDRDARGAAGSEQQFCSKPCKGRAAYLRRIGKQPTGDWTPRRYVK